MLGGYWRRRWLPKNWWLEKEKYSLKRIIGKTKSCSSTLAFNFSQRWPQIIYLIIHYFFKSCLKLCLPKPRTAPTPSIKSDLESFLCWSTHGWGEECSCFLKSSLPLLKKSRSWTSQSSMMSPNLKGQELEGPMCASGSTLWVSKTGLCRLSWRAGKDQHINIVSSLQGWSQLKSWTCRKFLLTFY